jgi:hypothetical protein
MITAGPPGRRLMPGAGQRWKWTEMPQLTGVTAGGRYRAEQRLAYPVHLRSVRTRVLDHVDRSTLPCFSRAVIAIAESLD